MRLISLILASCLSVQAWAESADYQPLTLERIVEDPSLSGKRPVRLQYSPDGSRITFLQGKENDRDQYDLWEYNIADKTKRMLVDSTSLFSGQENLSDEEKARRERMRVYGRGILEYKWSDDGKQLLFPINGDLFVYTLASGSSKQLTDTEAFETDSRFSPKGNYVSFIREQNLYTIDLETGEEKAITTDGGGVIKNGMAEFVAQEEMGRMTGYWWSPDEAHIAYTQVDETPVDLVTRNEIYADEVKLIDQRYPFAGTDNVELKLGIYSRNNEQTRWIDVSKGEEFYLARVMWMPNSREVTYQWQNRSQQHLQLRAVNVDNLAQRILVDETSSTWIDIHDSLRFLKDSDQFVWLSERNGYMHLYLYNNSGELVRQITSGNWEVGALAGIDESQGTIYFTGRYTDVLEQHLYRTSLNKNGPVLALTKAGKTHSINLASDQKTFIASASSYNSPTSVGLYDRTGELITWVEENAVKGDHPLAPYVAGLGTPEYGYIKADDGQPLQYRLLKPTNFDETKKYPVVVYTYGGPGVQVVQNGWSSRNLYLQYLAQQGYVVFSLDNRGSYHRGVKFKAPIYKNMGEPEVRDQVAGARFLKTLPYVNADKIAIYGHSYGGYMTMMSMFKAPNVFAAGVSGAPVSDWALYDTHYTERFMGDPRVDGDAYTASSVIPYAKNLKGELMIYHGMADDNVLFTHATKVFKELQDQGKTFSVMTYPGSKHSMRGKKVQLHLYRTITRHFDTHLKD